MLLLLCLFSFTGNWLSGQPGCEILEHNTAVKLDRGNLIAEHKVVLQVNNKAFDWVSEIALSFQKGDKLEILEAFITDKNGKIVRTLKKDEVTVASDIDYGIFYSDILSKSFSLHWSDYPFIITYRYRETTDKYIYLAAWQPYLHYGIPVRNTSLSLEVPAETKLNFCQRGGLKYETRSSGDWVIHKWSAENLPRLRDEHYSPPILDMVPNVIVSPASFIYDIEGQLTSWQSYGEWVGNLIRDLDVLTAEEKIKVHKIIEGAADRQEKVRRLYHYMQNNTHYVNVSLKVGGLKPYPASYVCKNKYGDCKALTIYMKALLKEAGIESFYTKVLAGENPQTILKEIPGQQFNHIILCVPIDSDTIWLENTSNFLPYNYLGTFTQGRYVLFVNGENSRLVMTPGMDEAALTDINTYCFTLDGAGEGLLSVTKHLRGESFESFINYRNLLSEKEIHEIIAGTLPLNNFDITDWAFDDHNRDDHFLTLRFKANVGSQFRRAGQNMVITPLSDPLPMIENPESRTSPVRIFRHVALIDTIDYNISPENKYHIYLPENLLIESKYGRYEMSFKNIDNNIRVIRKIKLNKGEYEKDEYEAFYDFFTLIRSSLRKTHIIINI